MIGVLRWLRSGHLGQDYFRRLDEVGFGVESPGTSFDNSESLNEEKRSLLCDSTETELCIVRPLHMSVHMAVHMWRSDVFPSVEGHLGLAS